MSGNIILNIGGSGGGTSLNFKVVGNPEPANPSENTIWVNTDVDITSWVFSAMEPETPAAGMVWITTGKTSTAPFNALKKNNITVYPISAKQYVGGAWVDKEAKSYQNGAWADWWNGHLYEYGNLHEQFTGGWTSDGYRAYKYNTASQFNTDNIYILGKNGGPTGGVGTVNKIDLSSYTKLKLLYTGTTDGNANLSVLQNKSDDIINAPLATAKLSNGTEQIVELNITHIDEGYVAIGTSRHVYIYDVWLE